MSVGIMNGHLCEITETGQQIKPLTDAGYLWLGNLLGACSARYGYFPAPHVAKQRRTIDPESIAKLLEMAEDRVPKTDHSRVLHQLAEARKSRLNLVRLSLRLESIGEFISAETYGSAHGDQPLKYKKGVRIKTSAGRTIEFYGSKREYISPSDIDGIIKASNSWDLWNDGIIGQELYEACAHLLPEARKAWRGKQKLAENKVASVQ